MARTVLFSNEEIAMLINELFEPCWQMVRPVPIVTIDFGDGKIFTRTLHGNIATYACTWDGKVLDILPGIYEPHAYINALVQLSLLGELIRHSEHKIAALTDYHKTQARALHDGRQPGRLVRRATEGAARRMDLSKKFIESYFENQILKQVVLEEEKPLSVLGRLLGTTRVRARQFPGVQASRAQLAPREMPLQSAEDLANWERLIQDTLLNETLRRRQIHEKLSSNTVVEPAEITSWLYKTVLCADIDDPYLGLGGALFANYPFQSEDSFAHQPMAVVT